MVNIKRKMGILVNVTKLRLIETKPLQKRLEKFFISNLFSL